MNHRNAIDRLIEVEGGEKFTNNPLDRGGPTKFGITQKTYSNFLGRPATVEDVKNMPRSHAYAIYKAEYWDKIGGDQIKLYPIAYAIFDQAVNRGVSTAVKQAQEVVGVKADGLAGSGTLNAINAISERDFLNRYLQKSLDAYQRIVDRDPTQNVFINGWKNRVSEIEKYASQYVTTTSVSIGAVILIASFFLIYLFNQPKRRTA